MILVIKKKYGLPRYDRGIQMGERQNPKYKTAKTIHWGHLENRPYMHAA